MKISLIATDLDGTFLAKNSVVTEENLNAVEKFKNKNVVTIPVTGRTLFEIPEKIRNNRNFRYFVFSNGAGIYDKENGTIFYAPIENNDAITIFNILNSYDTLIEIYTFGNPLIDKNKFNKESFNYYNIDKNYISCMMETRVPTDNFYNIINKDNIKVEMFNVFFKNKEDREECIQKFASFNGVEVTTSMDNNLEIIKKGVNKGTTLENLCNILKIDTNFVIALGDSKNDISMLRKAGTKLAVKNACGELKNIADTIICTNNENTIEYLQKHLGA